MAMAAITGWWEPSHIQKLLDLGLEGLGPRQELFCRNIAKQNALDSRHMDLFPPPGFQPRQGKIVRTYRTPFANIQAYYNYAPKQCIVSGMMTSSNVTCEPSRAPATLVLPILNCLHKSFTRIVYHEIINTDKYTNLLSFMFVIYMIVKVVCLFVYFQLHTLTSLTGKLVCSQ